MNKQLATVYLALGNLVEPLLKRLSEWEELESLFYRYGWEITLDEPTFNKINQALAVKAPLEQFLQTASSIRRRMEGPPESELTPQDIAELVRTAVPLFEALADFGLSDLTGLPAPLGDSDFWQNLGEDILNDLLEEYLRIYRPGIYLLLHFGGAIRYETSNPEGRFRTEYTKVVLDRSQILKLISNPFEAIKKTYKWGEPGATFEYERLIRALEKVLEGLGLQTSLFVPALREAAATSSPTVEFETVLESLRTIFLFGIFSRDQIVYEFGMEVSPALANGEATPSGLKLTPVLRGGTQGEVPLSDSFKVKWQAGSDVGQGVGLNVFPDTVNFDVNQPTAQASVEIVGADSDPWYLLGNERTARIEVYKPSLRLTIEGTADSPEASLRLGSGAVNGEPQARIVIPLDEADGFIKETVQTKAFQLAFSPEVIWSTRTGLTFNGKPTLDIDLPVSFSVGPVQIQNLKVYLRPSNRSDKTIFEIAATAGLVITVGPVTAIIDQVGFSFGLDFESENKNLGFVDLSAGFKNPTGIGLAIEAPSVRGAGFLGFAPEKQEYSGMLELRIAEKISVKAIGVLTTKLPDGEGYSLALIIFVEGFTPIQLGFGFALTGIGGLIGINRTFDEEALRSGLKEQALDSLMFPKDPVRNAPQIISNIGKVFPLARGHYLFGPMVQIAWGTPPLITAEVAILLEFGERFRLIVLAQIAAILPSRENDLVHLQLDAFGVIDFAQGTASIDATLYGSRLVKKFVLTGDMAMRLSWESPRNFALAVGGLHPAYNPPPNFPKLERLAIELSAGDNPRLRCEAYFAITANTLQFGARAELYAAALGFSINGEVGFDVLIQRDPFHFIADFHAQVQLKRGSTSICKVTVAGALSGPRPLNVKGKATFEVFWWDVSIKFDKTLLEGERPPAALPINVLPLLKEALTNVDNWVGTLPDSRRQMATFRNERPAKQVLLHPLGTLSVKQTVVPLKTPISRIGSAPLQGANVFTIEGTSFGTTTDTVTDFFAPAQFFEMSDDAKLASPSFESLPAGVEFASEGFSFPTANNAALETSGIIFETHKVTVDGDQTIVEPEAPASVPYQLPGKFFAQQFVFGAAGQSVLRRIEKYKGGPAKFEAAEEEWGIVDVGKSVPLSSNVQARGPFKSYSEARRIAREEERLEPSRSGKMKVMRFSELK